MVRPVRGWAAALYSNAVHMEQFITFQRGSTSVFLAVRSFSSCRIRFSPPIVSLLLNYYFVICLLSLEMTICSYWVQLTEISWKQLAVQLALVSSIAIVWLCQQTQPLRCSSMRAILSKLTMSIFGSLSFWILLHQRLVLTLIFQRI